MARCDGKSDWGKCLYLAGHEGMCGTNAGGTWVAFARTGETDPAEAAREVAAQERVEDLKRAACAAEEIFTPDELEEHAEKVRRG